MAESRKGKGTLKDQIARLEKELGDDGIALARKLAAENPEAVKLAFKYIDRPYRPQSGLKPSQRKTYWQLVETLGQEQADKWRNGILLGLGIVPAEVPAEAPLTTDEVVENAPANDGDQPAPGKKSKKQTANA